MSNEQNEINSQYDELKKVIDDASRIKTDINSNYKESLKTIKQDFSNFMLDNVSDEFKTIAERLGLFNGFAEVEDRKKREKKADAAIRSFFGKMFKKTSDFEFLKKGGKPKETTPPKADSYTMDLIASLYASRLIPEVQHALDVAGVEIRFTKPITKLDLKNDDDRNTIIGYINRSATIQNDIFEKNAEIEDVIYENIPDNMKFDSESNPKGIKKSQFQALAELQSKTDEMSMDGDAEKASDIVEKQCDKHFTNSKNQEMLALVTELILARHNQDEPEKPTTYDVEGEEPEVVETTEEKVDENLGDLIPMDME